MKFLRTTTLTFLNGMMLMALLCSMALNYGFYKGKLGTLNGIYCEGFLDGSQNAITGAIPKK